MVATDNRNRTVSEIRTFSSRAATWANRAALPGCSSASQIVIEKIKAAEDTLMNLVLEAGADDMKEDGGDSAEGSPFRSQQSGCSRSDSGLGIETLAAEVGMIPKNLIELEGKNAAGMVRLLDALDDQDDVQNVYSNFDSSTADVEG